MRIFLFLAGALLIGSTATAQQETVFVNEWQLADTIYGQLGTHVNTGLLFNRTFHDSTNSRVLNLSTESNADRFYETMQELKLMALDSSQIIGNNELYLQSSTFVGGYEFEEERFVFPMGIADFQYNVLDEGFGLQNGLLTKDQHAFVDASTQNSSAYSTQECSIVAPLFDYFATGPISIVFREQDFYSNYRTISEIERIEVTQNGTWNTLSFNEEYPMYMLDSTEQFLQVRISYKDGTEMYNSITLHTPELDESNHEAKFYLCQVEDDITHGANKLKYCFIPSCGNPTSGTNNPRPKKPYILVTGYRPPIFGQSFAKTWKLYNTHHAGLLGGLTNNDYDIYLVKFNIHMEPLGHGLSESADLLIEFLEDVNEEKIDEHNENVIQGSSMGADIVRLALLRMEKKHWENNYYPHHHTRLNINYDANFYGANIPLAYQYQIYSVAKQPAGSNTFGTASLLLKTYLYATMEQKTVKELIMYHADPIGFLFNSHQEDLQLTPTHHILRQSFLNNLAVVDNGKYIFPLPNSTRNIAISLGKINGTNNLSNTNDISFKAAGTYWWNSDFGLQKHQLRASEYAPSWYEILFRRKKPGLTIFPFSLSMDHRISVKGMQEIDNAAGSYLKGLGNFIEVSDAAYFTGGNFFNGKNHFSHKPVVTALGINKNLWPSDGSMTLDMQVLGLMYNDKSNTGVLQLSNHYGYPNLGRPNDHFNVTPFEAIYVDNEIDPHIKLNESNPVDKIILNDFINNEVEPWFLGLQNETLGAQARVNYEYHAKRIARRGIVVGYEVTPKTDPGDYTVAANADLILKAGNTIDLLVGTTVVEGGTATMTIEYEGCTAGMITQNNVSSQERNQNMELRTATEPETLEEYIQKAEVRIFPNPSNGTFTIASMQDIPINSFAVYDLNGNLIYATKTPTGARYTSSYPLKKGMYVVHVHLNGNVIQTKLTVL